MKALGALTWDTRSELLRNLGLLVLRGGTGLIMVYGHGLGKLNRLLEGGGFADPLGIGPQVSLALAAFAEVGCSLLLVLGLGTRLATIPLLTTMGVAAFVVHGADPWTKKEAAIMFALPYLTLLLTGPGRFSLDSALRRRA